MNLFSPAKINLFFRVLHRREDGFHEIASCYQAISLGDRLTLQLADRDHLTTDDPSLPCDASNLIMKALSLFRRKTGLSFHLNMHLKKNIPMQAGLGGGSSNAATLLWGCNQLLGGVVSSEELMKWGGEIGSDVPFFFAEGTAYCRGKGEEVQPLAPLRQRSCWIVKPSQGLSTPSVYAHCKVDQLPLRDPEAALGELMQGRDSFFNDLEQSAFRLSPSLSKMKQELLNIGFSHVTMTGSGTAFFCIGCPQEELKDKQWYARPVTFCRRITTGWYTDEDVR